MTLEIRLRPLARTDLDLHAASIAKDRPASAERFALRTLESLDLLAAHPEPAPEPARVSSANSGSGPSADSRTS